MSKSVVKTAIATIAAGQSLSSSVNLTTSVVTMLMAPDDWEPRTNISFQTSTDNATFSNMVDRAGKEIMLTVVPGCAMLVDPEVTQSTVFLKIRSGSVYRPIVQDSDRNFVLVLST